MPDELLIKTFKDGHIPKCIYCKRSVPWHYLKSTPQFGRGRWGNGHFCSLSCIEQWAKRHFTGKSEPRGLSHKNWGGVSNERS